MAGVANGRSFFSDVNTAGGHGSRGLAGTGGGGVRGSPVFYHFDFLIGEAEEFGFPDFFADDGVVAVVVGGEGAAGGDFFRCFEDVNHAAHGFIFLFCDGGVVAAGEFFADGVIGAFYGGRGGVGASGEIGIGGEAAQVAGGEGGDFVEAGGGGGLFGGGALGFGGGDLRVRFGVFLLEIIYYAGAKKQRGDEKDNYGDEDADSPRFGKLFTVLEFFFPGHANNAG